MLYLLFSILIFITPIFASQKKIDESKKLVWHNIHKQVTQSTISAQLSKAIKTGNETIVKKFLDEKANPNTVYNNDNTCLHLACNQKNPQIVFLLLEYDANPFIRNKDGDLPLHIACQKGCLATVSKLVCDDIMYTRRKMINIINKKKYSPLHIACMFNQKEVVHYLATIPSCNWISVNYAASNLLHTICSHNFTSLLDTLVTITKDIPFRRNDLKTMAKTRNKWDLIPLFIACIKNHTHIAQTLINENLIIFDRFQTDGTSALILAAANNNFELVTALCATANKEIIDHSNDTDSTALHIAVENNNIEITKTLYLTYNADPTIQDYNNFTAVRIAFNNKNYEILKLFCQK